MNLARTIKLAEPGPATIAEPASPELGASELEVRSRKAAQVDDGLWREWRQLVGVESEANSFAEPWFVDASLKTIRGEREIWLLDVRSGGSLIGVMPIAIELPYGRLPVIFTQNWCHHQMFLGTPLVRAGHEAAFWTAILSHLDSADWAWSFLHVRNLAENGPVHRGLQDAAAALGRSCSIVHRRKRAFLESDLNAEAYFKRSVRQKKRKELRRLRSRLAEIGDLRLRQLESDEEVEAYCDAFLQLEQKGWKGRADTALADRPDTEACFREVVRAAWANDRLQFLRLDLDGRPLAMLINLISPPGSFSFKTCFDEEYARFSPGVLLQIENLRILERGDVAWMDSCAMDDHPMIDHLWSERRAIVRVTVPLAGVRRRVLHAICRAAESGMALVREKFS